MAKQRRPGCIAIAVIAVGLSGGACKSKPEAQTQTKAGPPEAPANQQPADAADQATAAAPAAAALPPALKAALDPIEAQLLSDDSGTRSKGYDAMKALVAKHQDDAALANALLAAPSYRVARYGLEMWEKIGAADAGFVPAMRRAFGHPSDRIRAGAAGIFWTADRAPVTADLQRLLADKSCLVRVKARHVLFRYETPPDERSKAELAALGEGDCPAVQAWALQEFTRSQLSWPADDEKLVGRLETMAGESPYYQLRCLALSALAKMKVNDAEALIGKAFAISAQTALDTDYLDRSPSEPSLISESVLQQPTMAECAAHAWAVLHDLEEPEPPRKMVAEMWRKAVAARAATAKPPKKLCTRGDDCGKGKYCIAYSCQSLHQAEKAYWTFRELDKCSPADAEAHTRNASTPAEVESGLATHSLAGHYLKLDLEQANRKAFERHAQAIAKLACPAAK